MQDTKCSALYTTLCRTLNVVHCHTTIFRTLNVVHCHATLCKTLNVVHCHIELYRASTIRDTKCSTLLVLHYILPKMQFTVMLQYVGQYKLCTTSLHTTRYEVPSSGSLYHIWICPPYLGKQSNWWQVWPMKMKPDVKFCMESTKQNIFYLTYTVTLVN